ncbi:ArnT family glycosyltransferase, partial [Elusimicrobiota bacterium]
MKKKTLYLLILIIICYTVCNIYWVKKENIRYVFQGLYSHHFFISLNTYNLITRLDWTNLLIFIKQGPYPPLFQLLTSLAIFLFGKSYTGIVVLPNILLFSITIFFIYKIGTLIEDSATGLIAAFFFSSYPMVYGLSRLYCFNFALMTVTVFSIYCLLRTDNFLDVKWSVLFGLSLGAGMMTKYPFAAFLAGPVIYSYIKAVRTDNFKIKRIINVTTATLIGILLSLPRYNHKGMLIKIMTDPFNESIGPWYAYNNLRKYTLGIIEEQLSPVFFIILVLGLYYFIKKYRNRSVKIIFILWIILPWLILIFMPHRKSTDYVLPYIPAFALISSIGFIKSNIKIKFKKITLAVLIMISTIQYLDLSYGIGIGLFNLRINIGHQKTLHYFLPDIH